MLIPVNPENGRYDIVLEQGALKKAGQLLDLDRRVLIVTDGGTPRHYADALAAQCKEPVLVTIPGGEASKSIAQFEQLLSAMLRAGFTRRDCVAAVGGGVVGDLSAFAASCYMRGIDFYNIPTTLLSQVDSSVGGKTAVNLPEGKNLVGAFHQPAYVCADTDTLASLDEREWKCGCGEIAKCATIDGDDFFFWLSGEATALAQRDADVVVEAIARCVVFKANVVAQDVTERAGVRECLNYGHTLGHAIEAEAGFGTFSHGAAVAEGMRFAAQLARELVGASDDFTEAQGQLLDDLGLYPLAWQAPADDLLAAMKRDKKTRGGVVRFVLASDVGAWQTVSVDDETILRHLGQWRASKGA